MSESVDFGFLSNRKLKKALDKKYDLMQAQNIAATNAIQNSNYLKSRNNLIRSSLSKIIPNPSQVNDTLNVLNYNNPHYNKVRSQLAITDYMTNKLKEAKAEEYAQKIHEQKMAKMAIKNNAKLARIAAKQAAVQSRYNSLLANGNGMYTSDNN